MKPSIEFYFDFSSPYGYLASHKIEALAAKYARGVTWRPILLGVAFKATGSGPLPSIPLKGDYAKRDFLRSARFHGVPFRMPEPFPVSTVAACRAFYSLNDPKEQVLLAKALFRAYFIDNVNIGEASQVLKISNSLGLRPEIDSQAVKDKTRAEVEAALAKGVFGSPYIVIDGEPFWGVDRFDQIERWLKEPF
ncbi:MAG TPA: 2-hydroxychromene-2-carboxylate isomerase [Burkholderiales bacterium]|jgi:2-hydroxychromene-2-carboxylate isomerase|nr:2-hydroxychromene-2-carboxylate isomerase [Burkholderiales bacterium]HSA69401.1 2-hydroxychromene-2-carboxylate isomerase [Burkholderiales bacterium]